MIIALAARQVSSPPAPVDQIIAAIAMDLLIRVTALNVVVPRPGHAEFQSSKSYRVPISALLAVPCIEIDRGAVQYGGIVERVDSGASIITIRDLIGLACNDIRYRHRREQHPHLHHH